VVVIAVALPVRPVPIVLADLPYLPVQPELIILLLVILPAPLVQQILIVPAVQVLLPVIPAIHHHPAQLRLLPVRHLLVGRGNAFQVRLV
jgi:hypothetical protein